MKDELAGLHSRGGKPQAIGMTFICDKAQLEYDARQARPYEKHLCSLSSVTNGLPQDSIKK